MGRILHRVQNHRQADIRVADDRNPIKARIAPDGLEIIDIVTDPLRNSRFVGDGVR